jgi:beta-glucosidase
MSHTNTGARAAGGWPLLAFVSPPRPGVDGAPLRELAGFEKVYLQPGESTTVVLALTAHDLTRTASGGGRVAELGEWVLRVGDTATTLSVVDDDEP